MINVGQIRNTSITDYLTSIGVAHSKRPVAGAEKVYDTTVNFTPLDSLKSYRFLTKIVNKTGRSQTVNIRLRYFDANIGSSTEDMYQNLKTVTVNKNTNIDIIFTPNAAYNSISFDLVRIDVNAEETKDGVVLEGSTELYEIVNILDNNLQGLYTNPKLETLRQIGVRSRPGLRMCINGEEIFVGPSGVYELYNGIKVKYLGFIIDNNTKNSNQVNDFILDFTYEGEG